MIHLTYSNRTEALLEALVRQLHGGRRDPLAPVRIVVPNRNVERYVELGIARRLGIAANLSFCRLATLVEELLPGPLLTGETLRARVLRGLLDDDLLQSDALAPVQRYLHAAGSGALATEPRRAQLALHIARLFEEYGFSRAELLETWDEGEARFAGTPHEATERWQAALFRNARVGGRLAHAKTLRESIEELRDPTFETLHVFGLSYMARAFAHFFSAVGEHADLRLYSLNPCEEYWEDLESEGELRRRRRRSDAEPEWLFEDDPFELSVDTETPLLRHWGRPGREHVRLLGALTECDFESAFIDPVGELEASHDFEALPLLAALERPSLLRRLQHDILTRSPRLGDPEPSPRDESIRVLVCPSLRREVETVAAEIWKLIESVDDLSFDQIAVLVNGPDRDVYLPHIEAVFTEAHSIPFNVADLALASISPIVEGALRLLALPTRRFSRPEVLAVMTHPAVLGRVPEIQPHEWASLVDRLGIFHGIDHDDLKGTYIADEDRLSWEQGINRVALGAVARAAPISLHGRLYLPEESPVGSAMEARFALLARSLSSDVRFATETRLTLREWARFTSALLQSYLTPTSENEESALRRSLAVTESLAALDLDGTKVTYGLVWELLRGPLEELVGTRGQHLADGVAVSGLMPMRAIPFRAIFVLGLGEGRFPAPDRRDSTDLRAARRYAGDVTPPERDRYTFLETLLCAREHLVLSYVARDESTGDPLTPSTVVTELLDVIEQGYVPGARTTLAGQEIPLRRHESAAAREVLPEAAAEHLAARLGRELRDDLGDRLPTRLPAAEIARSVAATPGLGALLDLAPIPEDAPSAVGTPTLRLSLPALRRFLDCPLQGWTRSVLRLDDDDLSSDAATAEEPFAPSRLDETVVLRSSFVDAALAGRPWQEAYQRRIEASTAHGRWPLGPLARLLEQDHAEILDRWTAGWDTLDGAAARRLRFGAAADDEQGVQARDPIVLHFESDPRDPGADRPLAVEIVGTTELLAAEASVGLLLRHKPGVRGRMEELRYGLRGFFDHAALSVLGESDGGHSSVQLYADRDRPVRLRYAPFEPDEARAWLRDLVRDLLGGTHAYFFPIEAVLRLEGGLRDADGSALVTSIEEVREHYGGGQSRWGPVRDATTRAAPTPGIAEAIVARRFAPWLSRLENR